MFTHQCLHKPALLIAPLTLQSHVLSAHRWPNFTFGKSTLSVEKEQLFTNVSRNSVFAFKRCSYISLMLSINVYLSAHYKRKS